MHGILIIDKNVKTRLIASPSSESPNTVETRLIASLQSPVTPPPAPSESPESVQTRLIASPSCESTDTEQTRLIASPSSEMQSPESVETRLIASPSCVSPTTVETRLIASLQSSATPPPGGITGHKNPMLHENISRMMRWYKGRCTFEIHNTHPHFAWQPRFHDHIIRNEKSMERIRNYIINNPYNWKKDKFYS